MGDHSDFPTGLAFDDVLLIPGFSPIRSRREVDVSTRFSRSIKLGIPVVSANMDVVTESQMAIALARLGGIGVIHRFLSIEREVAEVAKVKRSEGILIERPMTLQVDNTVEEANELIKTHGIGGIVIIDSGRHVLGLVTKRDILFEDKQDRMVSEVMTPFKDLITADPGIKIDEAKEMLHRNKIEKLPVIEKDGKLVGLITTRDIVKRKQFPNATKDPKGRLRVAAAIGVKDDYLERAQRLVDADVDAIVVDIAHGHSVRGIETIKEIKKNFGVDVVAGNVATAEGTLDLIKAGADVIKVGVGPGSTCTTRIVAGAGVPQLTAIMDCVRSASDYDIPVIADGGIRHPGDVTKAIAAGASSIMCGSLFAGTDESPGPTILRDGIRYKMTRGMASLAATIDRRIVEQNGNGKRDEKEIIAELLEDDVPEGVEGLITYKGRLEEIITQLIGGLRSGMSYCGAKDLQELQRNAKFIRITQAGLKESHPHDISNRM